MTHVLSGLRVFACALISCIVWGTGCSSDDGGTGQGAAAEAALARRECYLGLEVAGVEHTGVVCSGTDSSSSVSGFHPNTLESALGLSILLMEPPALGDLMLSSLTIEIPNDDGVFEYWDAPVSDCSAVATDSAVDEDFGWTYFLIEISCSEPAQPADSNPGEPIELGNFSIVTFFTLD